ncbi:MAG TPA: hypothetical protein V6C86_15455 [Oculatellaceae cyanobacterium]
MTEENQGGRLIQYKTIQRIAQYLRKPGTIFDLVEVIIFVIAKLRKPMTWYHTMRVNISVMNANQLHGITLRDEAPSG